MTTSFLKLLCISLFVWTCSAAGKRISYTGYETHRFFPQSEKDVEMLNILHDRNPGVIFLRQVGTKGIPVDILFAPHLQTDLLDTLTKQMPSEMVSEDMEAMINKEEKVMQLDAFGVGEDKFSFGNYWGLQTIYDFQDNLVTSHPDLCEAVLYGLSFEGRPLRALIVSKPGSAVDKPVVFMDAGTHAREWITSMTCAYFMNQLVTKRDTATMATLLDKFNFVFAPMVNPDGFEYSKTVDRLWRKSRTTNNDLTCLGVDPNRNYGSDWGGTGSSDNKCSETYHGTGPFSIEETRSLTTFIKTFQNVIAYLSFHSYSQMILVGNGCDAEKNNNNLFQDQLNLASQASEAILKIHKTEYTSGNSQEILYPACGTSSDWALSEGIPWAYTFELRDTGTFGFLLPANQIKPTGDEITTALIAMCTTMATKQKE